ncbi:AGAP012000-PA-like protein [Anopheles sinensis]|uniref:AGAP012000-PA-like protein n=1 Tax=Anopheles sinensis TaxID=74873 RepID=A0A084WEV0_ANOSI|nr:AGAP012000-PA-like protein [Anopheles sinensis]
MPTVMEAIVHAMIDFRREILDNLQLSLEFHTEQMEEIKHYTEHMMNEQEKRIKSEFREEITRRFDQQQISSLHQNQESKTQTTAQFNELRESIIMLREDTNTLCNETSQKITNIERALGEISNELVPRSCDRVKSNATGGFYINPYGHLDQQFMVLCNFDSNFNLGGGWTVFQRRIDGSVNFYRNWTMYKNGFGNINGEHWLGLEKLHVMTRSGRHELLVLLEDFEGKSIFALYDEFNIGSEEEKYKLTVGKYSGTAGDSLAYHSGMKFSTFDQDNDVDDDKNVAEYDKGAWWFGKAWKSYVYHM